MQIYSQTIFNQRTPSNPLLPYNHRTWKRRRLKFIGSPPPPPPQFRCHVSSSYFESFYNNFISQIPSLKSNSLLSLGLGFASGVGVLLSTRKKLISNSIKNLGDWVLFTNPTPFNRFVILRCPSICFEGSELLEIRGRIEVRESYEDEYLGEELVYRRVCVGTGDGGVVSIDWPENLELEGERRLDSTVVIIPGTTEGSGERCVREFVCECLRRGCFPVVMNPRGCAGSPLTTPRLFTAADSDDVSTAMEYIKKARPWSTMVAVGWGYGANMLTKYLAEVGEQTPLTAATCINNPFNLEEATRCSPHNIVYDKKLTNGLIEILQSNKELFQGRTRRFDVSKALSSTSIRDFEKAMSMVSFGFDSLEEFYTKSSTIHVVKKVKIPTLFIQNDDGSVPVFSVPRNVIVENPFTSLLLCSSFPSSKLLTARLTMSWCQTLTIEWLTAVELGLLKGRHPLLMDADVSINPSKDFELLDEHVSGIKSRRGKNLLNFPAPNASEDHSLDLSGTTFKEANIYPRSSPKRISQIQNNQESKENNGWVHKASSIDVVVVDEGLRPSEGENCQVLQTAQSVISILDVTIPDILTDEQKQKVLTAVDQGESLMKAFQDAVPENVQENLTSAVSGILQNENANIRLNELFHLQDIPNVAPGLRSNVQERVQPHTECEKDESNSNQIRSDDPLIVSQPTTGNHDREHLTSKNLEKSIATQFHPNKRSESDITASEKDNGAAEDTDRVIHDKEVYIEHSDNVDSVSETGSKTKSSSQSEGAGRTRDSIEKDKIMLDGEKSEKDMGGSNSDPQHEKNLSDSCLDEEETSLTTHMEDKILLPASSSEKQLNNESRENHYEDVSNIEPCHDQNGSSSPSFNVYQALDALTGIDDSTQLAINGVFHLIEDMITQLAHERETKSQAKDDKNGENRITASSSGEHLEHDNKMKGTSEHPDVADGLSSYNELVSGEESTREPVMLDKCGNDTLKEVSMENYLDKEDGKVNHKPPEQSAMYLNSTSVGSLPVSSYGNSLYQEYLPSDIIPMMDDCKPLDLESTSALFLEYYSEQGQCKFLEKMPNEPPKDERNHEADKQLEVDELHDNASKGYMSSVKTSIMDVIDIEVRRRLSASCMQKMKSELSGDIEHVSNAVCLTLKDEGPFPNMKVLGKSSEEIAILQGEHVTRAVSSSLLETDILRETLPVGVVVAACLAALKKDSNVKVEDCRAETEEHNTCQAKLRKFNETDNVVLEEVGQEDDLDNKSYESKVDTNSSARNVAVAGAMSAAVGASALMVHEQVDEKIGVSSHALKGKKNARKKPISSVSTMLKTNDSLVSSLAEKAMSVAGPVVPTKDGEVDQEKLVAMLAELGQKGGILRLFGKVALLWGGIRGAMSLTGKLISFMRLNKRPLYQRISGFICIVLVLWSPVVVPLLPSLVQRWTTRSSSNFSDLSCIIGLYASILILITSWGRQIRGYEKPLEQYGWDLNSPVKVQEFLKGLIGGVILVFLIQSLNFTLGYVSLHCPTALPLSSSGALIWIKVYGKMLVLMIKELATATGVSLVEELLFRSWLPDEIAADLGYHRGIIISGLLFSLFQRSPLAIPGLWLLSLALTGARERSEGQLWVPIGLRTGILASNFIIQRSGCLTYHPNFPVWVTGTRPLQPFSGVIGLAAALVLALFLYPRQQHQGKRLNRTIKD